MVALTLLLVSLPCISDIYALPSSGPGAGGGPGVISGNQPNSIGGVPRSENPTSNCIGTDLLHPSTTNCASPANAPKSTVVQPSNCNVPTSAHTTNCSPSTSGSSNSLTVNNVQSSTSSGSTTTIPIANAGSNQKVHSNDQVTLDGSKSYDPNGHSLTFSWLQLDGGPVVILTNDNKAKPTFTAPTVTSTTTLTFQLMVNNGKADSNPSLVYVTIAP